MLLQIIPIIIIVNALIAIPAAIWIKGRTESILIGVIVASVFLRTFISNLLGGVDIVYTLTIVLVGLATAAVVNTLVLRYRNRNNP
jgi:hypothetical protein